MAKFTSRFAELGFYCCDEFHRFHNGEFSTEKECEIKALEKLADVIRVDSEPKVPKAEEAPKSKPKAPTKMSSGK